jgi:uncharacterized protein (TIGR02266 family)
MTDNPPGSYPSSAPAREARQLLSRALEFLQHEPPTPEMDAAVEAAASAANALYGVENSATTLQASKAGVHIAVEHLGRAIKCLQEIERIQGKPHAATERIARTLALLYPVARASLRQRRDVILDTEATSERLDGLRALANVPPAPPPGRPRRSSGPFGGRDQRNSGDRVTIEVDIGVLTESHFYAGLSQDLSRGGVFIATYQPLPPGTAVTLFFGLPGGHEVHADGVVRWTREASDDAPPGMGVAFHVLRPADVKAIEQFCAGRAPLYYDTDDD